MSETGQTTRSLGKRTDLLIVTLGYLLAIAGAAATIVLLEDRAALHPLLDVLVADVVATIIVFLCSLAWRNSSWYDAYWSVAPPVIGAWFLWLSIRTGTDASVLRQLLVMLVVGLWSVRLTVNWAWGWTGMDQEDWRYVDLRGKSGALWWPLSFAGIHLFPTLCVFAGCLPLYPALALDAAPPGLLDGAACLLGLGAVWLEYRADADLNRFRAERTDRSEVLETGVWSWCRHPNYLGEIGFWTSLFLFGVAAYGGVYPFSWLGPAVMLALFLIVSIPMIERRLDADKPGYASYRARTPMLLPRPGRRPA